MSDEELIIFLGSELQEHPHRDDFPQETVDFILGETFSRFESLPPEEQDVSFPPLLSGLADGVICKTRGDYETDNITDKAWRAMMKFASTHPVAVDEFEEFIGQDGQMIRPNVLIEGVADLLWRPDVPKYIESGILHTMNYLYAFYEQDLTPAIIENLDFENPEKFFRTGIFLDTIRRLHALSEMISFSEHSAVQLENILETALREKKGSYFLMLQTTKILEEMRGWKDASEFGKRTKILEKYGEAPRTLAPGITGYYDFGSDGLFIGDERGSTLRPITGTDLVFNGSEQGNRDGEAMLIHDFTYLSRPDIRQLITETIGINLSRISIPEQISFLEWAKKQPVAEIERVREFIGNYGINGVRTFFSVDENRGSIILSIGERVQPDIATAVFEKHAELLDAAKQASAYIGSVFKGEIPSSAIRTIESGLLGKATQLLKDFYAIAFREGPNSSQDDILDPAVLDEHFKEFEKIKADIELWKGGFRTLYEEGIIKNFSDIVGTEFGAKSPEELTEEDKNAMRTMYDENYPESAGYSDEFRETLFRGLEEAFTKKGGTRFYVLKKDGKLIGYNRFEDLPETEGDARPRKYVGSFNVAPEYRGSKLGDKMFDDCLAQETRDGSIITAYADPTLPISAHYLETNGFVATGIENIGGRPLLRIISDPDMNAKLSTKRPSFNDEVDTGVADQGSPREYVSVRKTGLGDMPAIASSMLEKGWLLTRLQKDTGNDDRSAVIAVFEKPRA